MSENTRYQVRMTTANGQFYLCSSLTDGVVGWTADSQAETASRYQLLHAAIRAAVQRWESLSGLFPIAAMEIVTTTGEVVWRAEAQSAGPEGDTLISPWAAMQVLCSLLLNAALDHLLRIHVEFAQPLPPVVILSDEIRTYWRDLADDVGAAGGFAVMDDAEKTVNWVLEQLLECYLPQYKIVSGDEVQA